MPGRKPAPKADAPIKEHKEHAKEFLERPEHKTPPPGYRPTDEVKE